MVIKTGSDLMMIHLPYHDRIRWLNKYWYHHQYIDPEFTWYYINTKTSMITNANAPHFNHR